MYFEVTVKETFETEKGNKSKNKKILVEAVSVSDAEKVTYDLYKGVTFDFEVKGAKESAIREVVLSSSANGSSNFESEE